MAGDIIVTKVQLNDSGVAARNFIIDTSANNGSLTIKRGNIGAEIEDLLTINAAGEFLDKFGNKLTDFKDKLLSTNGYQKLPGGLILQWGRATLTAAADRPVSFPMAFPNACMDVFCNPAGGSENYTSSAYSYSLTGFLSKLQNASSGAMSAGTLAWLAIGN